MKVGCFVCVSVLASGVAVGSGQEVPGSNIDIAFRAHVGHCLDRFGRDCKETLEHIDREVCYYIREQIDYDSSHGCFDIHALIVKLNECEQLKKQIEEMLSSIERLTVPQERQSDSE